MPVVIEVVVVIALLGSLVGGPMIVAMAPWEFTFGLGWALVALGMAIGVPAGAYYHFRLWHALKPVLGRTWWLNPTGLHRQLGAGERPRVMRWFRVGAAGFLIAIVGCVLVAVGAMRS
jgi:hypothetical protein